MGGKTKLTGKLMNLEPEKAAALEKLAERLGVRQSELMRQAIDDLLAKHQLPKKRGSRPL